MTPNTATEEAEATRPLGTSQFWLLQLEAAKKDHRDFFEYGKKVEKRFLFQDQQEWLSGRMAELDGI
jgi:hypothetical protein